MHSGEDSKIAGRVLRPFDLGSRGAREKENSSKSHRYVVLRIHMFTSKWRLTAEFSGRGLTCQHAGAAAPAASVMARPPAAEHFMRPGPLQRFVRRHGGS